MANIAVIGCLHGLLDKMYSDLLNWQNTNNGEKIDLVICCGDFQSLRDEQDMDAMSVPDKYKILGEFWKYYTGEK